MSTADKPSIPRRVSLTLDVQCDEETRAEIAAILADCEQQLRAASGTEPVVETNPATENNFLVWRISWETTNKEDAKILAAITEATEAARTKARPEIENLLRFFTEITVDPAAGPVS